MSLLTSAATYVGRLNDAFVKWRCEMNKSARDLKEIATESVARAMNPTFLFARLSSHCRRAANYQRRARRRGLDCTSTLQILLSRALLRPAPPRESSP